MDELVELAVEVMSMPEDSTVRIAGTDKLVAVVKSRFIKCAVEGKATTRDREAASWEAAQCRRS